MRKTIVVMMALVTAQLSCSNPEDDADLLPPSTTSVVRPLLDPRGAHASFGRGWFPMEVNAQGAWRWMGATGEIKITTHASPQPAHVRIEGWVPDELRTPTTLELRVDGELLDSFVPPKQRFVKEYNVPVKGGDVLFTVHASVTAIPPGDSRELGFALVSFSWDPVSR